jgi:DNA ligase (NAD+)
MFNYLTIEKIVELLKQAQTEYWDKGTSFISDTEWDMFIERVRKEDPTNPILDEIGGAIGDVKHKEPMLSLQKVYKVDELCKWIKDKARTDDELFMIQPKYDGISGCYENGRMSTRGNGHVGEDITRHKRGMMFMEEPKDKVLGELVIPFQAFEKLKDQGDVSYKTPRNMVAGLLNRKEPLQDCEKTGILFVDHDYVKFTKLFLAKEAHEAYLTVLIDWFKSQIAGIIPLDGVVIKIADKEYAKSLGSTAHHPCGAMAFKFATDTVTSTITKIEWLIGKNKLTPRATIEPVELGGVTVSKLTLHNAEHVVDNDIAVGDTIALTRSGDVIPYYLRTEEKGKYHAVVPEVCPYCGNIVEWKGPEIICNNPECSIVKRIEASCRALGIEGIGPATIQALVDKGIVSDFNDFVSLTEEAFLELEGFAEVSARKAYKAIESKLNTTFDKFIACLCIPGVSNTMAKNVAKSIDFVSFINGDWNLDNVEGFGPKRKKVFEDFYKDNCFYISNLANAMNVTDINEEKGSDDKQTICFTGKMPEKRSYYEAIAEERGLKCVDKVTSNLSFLVVADKSSTSSKTKSAQKYGVTILSLEEWLNG